ncbi:helix-turn-helix domain-containing protein [Marinobacterium sp. D7]|uniref:helix-turn-helix domain-containing protein n=1 Tax=Marinobacterium ramblicola TaxID=2849041 RepID=UPI001C2D51AC|nr:helix-turn-helix transcriptional regulator [Marinobacterium ramblicola]MBV1788729.1 helix-turn-helix domain-containing protein [Marinobacterium ramblicola]
MSDFWDRLKEERIRLGKSQEAFGAIGGVARNAQHNYEKGARQPDIGYLAAIAAAGADIQYIITGIRSEISYPTPSSAELQLVDHYRKCSADGQQHLLAIGQALACMSENGRNKR